MATDNCGIENITNDGTLTYAVGTITVTHAATDIHGNTSTCEQLITVADNEFPVSIYYQDADGDGKGNAAVTIEACS